MRRDLEPKVKKLLVGKYSFMRHDEKTDATQVYQNPPDARQFFVIFRSTIAMLAPFESYLERFQRHF